MVASHVFIVGIGHFTVKLILRNLYCAYCLIIIAVCFFVCVCVCVCVHVQMSDCDCYKIKDIISFHLPF